MDVSDQRLKAKEEAAAWILRLESGDATRSDRAAFVEWLRESPLHVAEMLRLTNVHDALASFDRWADVDAQGVLPEPVVVFLGSRESLSNRVTSESRNALAPHSRQRPRWQALAAAAACLIAVGIGGIVLYDRLGDSVIATERGERRTVTLSDGSVLQIDPDTRLHVHFEKTSREVRLDRGRAVFRVAKNPARPFVVKTEETIVRAVGTAFGVERSRAGVRVTVSEGKVAVWRGSRSPDSASSQLPQDMQQKPRPRKSPAEIFLTVNQQITVPQSGSAEAVHEVDSERELAWARGQLVFEKTVVAAVVEDFNRYNQVQLHVADARLAGQLVSGVFDASDPESFIAFLHSTANIRVTRSEGEAVELASAN